MHATTKEDNMKKVIICDIESLTDQEIAFVIMHEKRHELHKPRHNKAADYLINQKLIDDGPIDLPRTSLLPDQ